jgi:hypothetical protein
MVPCVSLFQRDWDCEEKNFYQVLDTFVASWHSEGVYDRWLARYGAGSGKERVVRPYLEAALHPDIRILIGSDRPGVLS